MPQEMMKDIKRSNIFNNTSPVTTTYDWDFKITRTPICMQGTSLNNLLFGTNPSANGIFRLHTDSMQVPTEPISPQPLTVSVRGFRRSQVGGDIPDFGTFGFNVQDFESSELQVYITALAYKSCDPNTKAIQSGFGPLDFFFDFELYQLNTRRKPIKMWKMEDCLFTQFTPGGQQFDGTITPHSLSQVFGTTDHYEIYYNNNVNGDEAVWVKPHNGETI